MGRLDIIKYNKGLQSKHGDGTECFALLPRQPRWLEADEYKPHVACTHTRHTIALAANEQDNTKQIGTMARAL